MVMYDTKCNNGIVGLFCQATGCYYNSDCFDGYCNMYSKCDKKSRPSYISDLENQLSNALDGLTNNNGTESEGSTNSTTGTPPKSGKGSQAGKSLNSTRTSPPSKAPKSKE